MNAEQARPEDAGELTAIAHAAKGHWGYPESRLRRWEGVLTVTPEYIRGNPTHVAVSGGSIVGFCSVRISGREAYLDHLWVLPSDMGKGVGRFLFGLAEGIARAAGAARIRVESDPHAEGFYIRMGAARYGRTPASMDGNERYLPLMEKTLPDERAARLACPPHVI
jgi:ribosomal protein S18 acetylase RimI-like enzyme